MDVIPTQTRHHLDSPAHVACPTEASELTSATAPADVSRVAAEAHARLTDPDPERRARFMARKGALLALIESTTGGEQR